MRIIAAMVVLMSALTACTPWGGGEDCPYSELTDSRLYDWGNRQGKKLKDGEEALHQSNVGDGDAQLYSYQVGDNDIIDHFLGYSDGYFGAVMEARFGRRSTGGTGDYPEVEAYARGYTAGLMDGADITASFTKDESAAFAEGFADAYLDDKDLCF